jgi:hypothetical protein
MNFNHLRQMKLSPAPDHVSCELSGELVVLNLATGIYYGLNSTGYETWKLLCEQRSVQEVVDALYRKYGETADHDESVLEFVRKLLKAGLVVSHGT